MPQSTVNSIYWRNDIYVHWYIKDVLCGIFIHHIARRKLIIRADQGTSHYLNKWCLVNWRIYASLSLNELITMKRLASLAVLRVIWMCSNKIVKSGSGRKRVPVARYLLRAVVHNLRIVDTIACFMFSCYLVPNQYTMADSISLYKKEHSKKCQRGLESGLLAGGSRPSPEPMLTYRQWGPLAFSCG